MHEWQRLSHVRWECKYQVVIIATGMPNRSPQRGLPHAYGPLGGAFLMPRPMAVVDYLICAYKASHSAEVLARRH
jgi:hypothetical protein